MDRYEKKIEELRTRLNIAARERGIGSNKDQRWDFITDAIIMIKDLVDAVSTEEYEKGYHDGYDTAYLDWKEGKA